MSISKTQPQPRQFLAKDHCAFMQGAGAMLAYTLDLYSQRLFLSATRSHAALNYQRATA